MATILPVARQQYFGSDGQPLVGGLVYTYLAGTSTPAPTWVDAAKSALNTNPIVLDARGEATVFWEGQYKVELRDELDNLIWTVDNIQDSNPLWRTSETGSLRTPTGTIAQRDVSPDLGYFRFNSELDLFEGNFSDGWKQLTVKNRPLQETTITIAGTTPVISPHGTVNGVADGTILLWDLTANSTPTIDIEDGEYVTLMVSDGTAFTITWPGGVIWRTIAPTLDVTNRTPIQLWAVDGVIYGAW